MQIVEKIFIKFQILFPGKVEKNIILSSAEFALV